MLQKNQTIIADNWLEVIVVEDGWDQMGHDVEKVGVAGEVQLVGLACCVVQVVVVCCVMGMVVVCCVMEMVVVCCVLGVGVVQCAEGVDVGIVQALVARAALPAAGGTILFLQPSQTQFLGVQGYKKNASFH